MFEKIQRGRRLEKWMFPRKDLLEWSKKAQQKDAKANYYLGLFFIFIQNKKRARRFFERAFEFDKKKGYSRLKTDVQRRLLALRAADLVEDFMNHKIVTVSDRKNFQLRFFKFDRDSLRFIEFCLKNNEHETILAYELTLNGVFLPFVIRDIGATFLDNLKNRPIIFLPKETVENLKNVFAQNRYLEQRYNALVAVYRSLSNADDLINKIKKL